MHNEGHFGGNITSQNIWQKFEEFFVSNNCTTLLDCGSGKGVQWEQHPWKSNPKITCYDPAWPPLSTLPVNNFDMIMSKDCLEHIPMETLEECVQWIYDHADVCTAHFISDAPATKNLPNGENAHCTIMKLDEYEILFRKYAKPGIKTLLFRSPNEYKVF